MNFKSITLALMLAMTSSAAMAIPYSPDYLQADQTDSETGSMQFIPKGNFESWSSQSIKESGIIGGNTVTLMHIGSPWGSSNVWAKVSGVTKTNVSVYRDTHPGHGHCAKLYTHIVEAKVLGIINIKVLAAGSIFLGSTLQPITDTKNPMAKLNAGIRFTKRPKAIVSIIEPILSKVIAYARMASQGVLLLPGRTWPIVYSTCKSVGKTPGATFMPSV